MLVRVLVILQVAFPGCTNSSWVYVTFSWSTSHRLSIVAPSEQAGDDCRTATAEPLSRRKVGVAVTAPHSIEPTARAVVKMGRSDFMVTRNASQLESWEDLRCSGRAWFVVSAVLKLGGNNGMGNPEIIPGTAGLSREYLSTWGIRRCLGFGPCG